MAFVYSGGYHGHVVDIHISHHIAVFRKRLLDADAEGSAVRLCSDAQYISTQIDDRALHTAADKKILQSVRDESLGYRTQIQGGIRGEEGQFIAVERKISYPTRLTASSMED